MKASVRIGVLVAAITAVVGSAQASVDLTDHGALAKRLAKTGDKPANRPSTPSATGSIALIDSAGLKYFINTQITFSTSSSASGAASEASYTHAVNATTSGGGTVSSTLNDAFDGYNTLCVSLTATGPCATSGPSNQPSGNLYEFYNQTGAAPVSDCGGRQFTFPTKTLLGQVATSRKVYVPTNDNFIRWTNIFTNTGMAPITFRMITGNNLGSDSNTVVVTTSSGDTVASPVDNWVTSFQSYSGTTSSDPRLAHVLQGPGAPVPLTGINFVNGDDNPYWSYTITLQPGQTRSIVNFAAGTPSKASAAAQAARLVTLPTTATACSTPTESAQVGNFVFAQAVVNQIGLPASSRVTLAALAIGIALAGLVATRRRRSVR